MICHSLSKVAAFARILGSIEVILSERQVKGFPRIAACAAYVRAVLKPQSSVLIIAERGEVKVVKSCARARSAQVRPKGHARLQF